MELLLILFLLFLMFLAALSLGAFILALGAVMVVMGVIGWPWLLAGVVYLVVKLVVEGDQEEHCTCHTT